MGSLVFKQTLMALFGALCAGSGAQAEPAAVPPNGVHALVDVTVIDVVSGSAHPHQTVVWDRSRILSVGKNEVVTVPANAQVVAGANRYLIPGLWDMHVHLPTLLEGERLALPLFIAYGVTGVRDMGEGIDPEHPDVSQLPVKRRWNTEALSGLRVGPRVLASAGFFVDGPSIVRGKIPEFFGASNPEQAREVARYLKDERAGDFIKVYNNIPREAYFALMDEAHRLGIVVAGHKPVRVSFLEAVEAGQHSIEHAREILLDTSPVGAMIRANPAARTLLPSQLREVLATHDPVLLQAIFSAMTRNDTYYCPTLVTRRFDAYAGDEAFVGDSRLAQVHPRLRAEWLRDVASTRAKGAAPGAHQTYVDFLNMSMATTAQAQAAGVKILAGSDAGDSFCFFGATLHDELVLMVRGGMSPLEALRAAIVTPAQYVRREAEFGAITAGKIADMVLLDANPLQDIANTRRIHAVVFNGRLFDRAALDRLIVEARAVASAADN